MNRTYLKQDVVRELALRSGHAQHICKDVLDAYHEVLLTIIEEQDNLSDYGFFNFGTRYIPEHESVNPQNQSPVSVKGKYRVVIKPGKTLRDAALKITQGDK